MKQSCIMLRIVRVSHLHVSRPCTVWRLRTDMSQKKLVACDKTRLTTCLRETTCLYRTLYRLSARTTRPLNEQRQDSTCAKTKNIMPAKLGRPFSRQPFHTHCCWRILPLLRLVAQQPLPVKACLYPLVKWAWISVTFCYRWRIVSPTYGGTVYSGLEPMMGILLSRSSWRLYHQTGPWKILHRKVKENLIRHWSIGEKRRRRKHPLRCQCIGLYRSVRSVLASKITWKLPCIIRCIVHESV